MKPRTLSLAITALTLLTVAPAWAADGKPNFVFVVTDDQRWDAMGLVQREHGEHARFPWFQTPHMDRMATEGVRFRNAFVTLSLCSPSRAVFLTGRYNHFNGVAGNRTPFPETSVTHASLLRAAGYTTAYVGKWHMGGQRGQRPGFDYSASFVGQGRYFDCPFEINGEATTTQGWVDDVSTDYAIAFLKQRHDKPFSLVLGFKSPHGPRGGANLPERLRNLYASEKSRPVPNLGVPAIYNAGSSNASPGRRAPSAPEEATVMPSHLDYLRHVAGADENLGRLLKALDELKLTDNTVVVFASDNGYYLGEHGLGDKRSLYEESLRIPLLIRYPKLFPKGKVFDEMVLNLDLAPTFLELAGLGAPREMQGRSWVPLIAGKSTGWRTSFLAQYFAENQYQHTPTIVGVRTASAKLVKYPGHVEWTELFDLAKDLYEVRNLASDAARKESLTQLQAEFDAQVKLTGYRVPDYADKPGDGSDPPAKKKSGKAKKKQATEN
jgi:arylsulfatase A-like enzyme